MPPRATRPVAHLLPLGDGGLPGWCEPFLDVPERGEFFASRAWYDLLLSQGLPQGGEPVLAVADGAVLPLLRQGRRLSALTSPYTLDWRPLLAPGIQGSDLREAGRALGRVLRFRRPIALDTLDPDCPGLPELLEGAARAGLRSLHYLHTRNWHEVLDSGTGWQDYLGTRPPALRNTIARKLARAGRETEFELLAVPGSDLEAGIAAYEAVRARSWKPDEPFPAFDRALIRKTAAAGWLRLGVLRERAGGHPLAAQYWVLDRGGRRATVLKLAHTEESRASSPGTVLTARMIRALIEKDGVSELDFGRGDDAYKRLWVGTCRQRVGVLLVDPRHPAGLLEMSRHAAGRLRGAFGSLGRRLAIPPIPPVQA